MATKNSKSDIAVSFVEIEIAGTKLKLTLEQVGELKKMLAKAFPEPTVNTVYVPGPERIVHRYPYPPTHWMQSPRLDDMQITCSAAQARLGGSSTRTLQLQ